MTVRDLIVELQKNSLDLEVMVARSRTMASEVVHVYAGEGAVVIDASEAEVEVKF